MNIILDNRVAGRSIKINVSDTFVNNTDDIRVIIGTDCYKLVSTKSEADINRETVLKKFADDNFEKFYTDNIAEDKYEEVIMAALMTNPECKKVLDTSDPKMVVTTLITAYKNFKTIYGNMQKAKEEIKNTKEADLFFFDYIIKLQKALDECTCLKEFHDKVYHIRDLSAYDDRTPVGMAMILDTLSGLFEKEKSVCDELSKLGTNVDILNSPIFSDKNWWELTCKKILEESKLKLENLKKYWAGFIAGLGKDDNTSKLKTMFVVMAPPMNRLVTTANKYVKLLAEDNDATSIENTRAELIKRIPEFCSAMRTAEVVESLDPRSYHSKDEEEFINVVFSAYRRLEQSIIDHNTRGEIYDWKGYLTEIKTVYYLWVALEIGTMECSKFIKQEYNEQELNDIIRKTEEYITVNEQQDSTQQDSEQKKS